MRLSALPLLLTLAAPPAAQPADLIVVNAGVYAADDARPLVVAFAVRDGKVAFVGSSREARALAGDATHVVDLDGRTVIPGMVDAHAHYAGLAQTLSTVDLMGVPSYDELIARVRARAAALPKGTWVQGRGWDQNQWADGQFPTHEALSAAVPDHPVYLTRVDGHAALVNSAAMRAANLTRTTRDPSGGRILKAANGDPTGVLIDRAQGLVSRVIPPETRDDTRRALLAAQSVMHRWGLTGVHDAGAGRAMIELYEEMARAGELDLRLYAMIADDSAAIAHFMSVGPRSSLHNGRLWVRSIKLYSDGALGSRGAALLEPYSDDPGNSGLLISPLEHIRDVAERALARGFQVTIHAIGDRGNRIVLDAYEQALDKMPQADHRFRIEHAQILHYSDIPRFAQLGVIPSMQASHQTSDMYWAGKRLGPERLLGAYAWRSLLNTGVIIPNGSDFPVEYVNPLISFHAAIARQDANDYPVGGWYPDQRMTRDEALKSMTLWPAYSAFQEDELGSLTVGKHADFVVLDQDIMRVPAELVLSTKVLTTYVGGRVVYRVSEDAR
ncbi:MAG TPA: amidohydrolase [Gemmatimonadaceae bacterium]|nr:amidohydrolase [Gemmatimonadaceae bacterium]